ncbi:MAG: CidA/LrgA family protein [Oceanospirillales bacterium]|uniref:Holin-like protein n=1 Tax=Marinobacterium halophilum TaxID=267374 RepID=A0A2P8F121_9GAMM|nr:CidA/LrgA family protein [Marinobacterium halophilum]MBR9829864.1 CidA/LrgA family protein [Oceanospirillales bacterium]PSL15413.1 holin-like protein [Marinobacterium halophilum]
MLAGLLLLLGCQLLGEWIVLALALPVPGPVMGMVLLLVGLVVHGKVPGWLRVPAEGLLRHLALLFVPAGVGLMVHAELIAAEWLVILVALVLSTVVTILVTALVLKRLTRGLQLDTRRNKS